MSDPFGRLAEGDDAAVEMAALRSLVVRLAVALAEDDGHLDADDRDEADEGVLRRAVAHVVKSGRPVTPCRLFEFRLIDAAAHPVCDLCRWWRDPPAGEITRPA